MKKQKTWKDFQRKKSHLNYLLVFLILSLTAGIWLTTPNVFPDPAEKEVIRESAVAHKAVDATKSSPLYDFCSLDFIQCDNQEKFYATITAFNSTPGQTDDSPCVGAGGFICGRNDVIACPRKYKIGTKVKINGNIYECLDRLAVKYDNRFDIFMNMDIAGAKKFGIRRELVTILK